MILSPLLLLLVVLATTVGAAATAWAVRGRRLRRHIDSVQEEWQLRFDRLGSDNDKLRSSTAVLKKSLDADRALLARHKSLAARSRTEIQSAREKADSLSKELSAVTEECGDVERKLSRAQSRMHAVELNMKTQQEEFDKNRALYRAKLDGAADQNAALERRLTDARNEHASLRNLLLASKAEHESITSMLDTAQARLKDLEDLENRYIAIQAENAELRQESVLHARETASLQRDLQEFDALKKQNKDLAQCLQSMEASRRQYEEDARRYREQYERSEQESESLQSKLGKAQKRWSDLRLPEINGQAADLNGGAEGISLPEPDGEEDDLTEIIGIGKVFARTLNRMGIYHFRQIAAFGPTELARINAELKEFRGRIEHDDWIGQAKELHFRKYGIRSIG